MITASQLIGSRVVTESGTRAGRVHDLRARKIADRLELTALVVGRRGMVERLISPGADPLVRGDVIPWDRVVSLADGRVVVRDPEAGFGGHPPGDRRHEGGSDH